jgi:putative membrane protein
MYWNGWAWLAMGLSMAAFWALVGLAVWIVVRAFSASHSALPTPPTAPAAEETLRRRYAAGELDDEEFNRRLRVLRGDSLTQV